METAREVKEKMMQNKPRRKALSWVLALTLALTGILSSCILGGSQTSKAASESAATVAAALQGKYEDSQTVNYTEGEKAVARDHQFVISYDFDPIALGMANYTDIACLYYDAALTQPVSAVYDWASEDKKSYSISPWEYPGWAIYAGGTDTAEYPYGFNDGSNRLFDKGPNADWGDAGTMYLATKVDLKTGAPLDKPTVQVITVKGELDTPNLSLSITDDGIVQFSWDAVKGAKAYYIVELTTTESSAGAGRTISSASLIGQTTGTQWSSETKADTVTGGIYQMNKDFTTSLISEDEWLSPATVEAFKGQYDPEDGAVISEGQANRLFCVIAVNESGTSMYSRMLDINDIASLAPATIAYNMEKLSEEGFSGHVEGVPMMPAYRWVVMCNGALSQRLVDYDFDAAATETQTWYSDENSPGAYEAQSVDVLKVPYTVDGTAFDGTLIISGYDKQAWGSQLDAIEKRQESLRSKTGDVKREITYEDEGTTEAPAESGATEIAANDTAITASSALSEYLALNMLNGATAIDLSVFPESLDTQYLADAWAEAFYQNPLILGVSDIMVSYDGKTLYLAYEDDQATREKKQAEISAKVDQVVSQIITDKMTAQEKEFAINQYLCDTVTYDEAALDNAAQNGYVAVDSEYNDSFTAYGALVKGVGVCASYSAAFKLLADGAGLDCVVVTGYLNGSLGHAWNRVDLGDQQWATVDSTNNDIDTLSNALLNVPDSAIATTLVEDDLWAMDSAMPTYRNESNTNEFYHVEGLFFDKDAVVGQIVKELSSSDTAVIRTDYSLNDAQFYEIGSAVVAATGKTDLAGFYWMGVIVITSDLSVLESLE